MEPLLIVVAVLVFYFAPTFFAPPSNRASVFALSLMLGWTLFGWALAMYLAIRALETGK